MSSHTPVKEKDAQRGEFQAEGFTITKPPDPSWKAGQGLSSHPSAAAFSPATSSSSSSSSHRLIQPGVTEMDSRMMYKIMIGAIAPRPVAMVGTYGEDGTANLAPISWYQAVCKDPPLVMISFGGVGYDRKDSERNIKRTGEFCISSSSEPYAEALNYASVDCPANVSEFALSGLTPKKGQVVNAPLIAEAPVSFELEVYSTTDFHSDEASEEDKGSDKVKTGCMVLGRIKMIHIRDDCILQDGALDPGKMLPVSRFGGLLYGTSDKGYELERPVWDKVKDTNEVKAALSRADGEHPSSFQGTTEPGKISQRYP